MSVNRVRLSVVGAAGFVLLGGIGLVCCARPSTPAVDATQPRAADSGVIAEAERPEPPSAQNADDTKTGAKASRGEAAEAVAPTIEMEQPERPEPRTPRYLSIVEEINVARPAKVHATVAAPSTLELTTENVRRIRVTREGLPLARDRSIVLRIDGQGIEWTRKYIAVELERSPAGAWTVVRRRPLKP